MINAVSVVKLAEIDPSHFFFFYVGTKLCSFALFLFMQSWLEAFDGPEHGCLYSNHDKLIPTAHN